MADLEMIKPRGVQNLINKFCYTIGIIPTSYKQSLTYEEQILAIGHYLETVVYPAINNNAEALTELQGLFVELKNYVDNYFDNLDVQEEINNKIDDMVEQGTLQEIIAAYINTNAIISFNSVDDMINSTALVNGSTAKTLGYYSKNDGGKGIYKIRNITNEDVPDGGKIIAMQDENLVAELIEKEKINIKQYGAKGDGITDDTIAIQNAVNNFKNVFIPDGTFYITNNITITNTPTTIYGNGDKSIIKNRSNNSCFEFAHANYNKIKNLYLDIEQGQGIKCKPETIENHFYIEDIKCNIANSSQNIFDLKNMHDVKILNCNIRSNEFSNTSANGIVFENIVNANILNTVISNIENGLIITDSSTYTSEGINIEDCLFYRNKQQIVTTNSKTLFSLNISNSLFDFCTTKGIEIKNAQCLKISKNFFGITDENCQPLKVYATNVNGEYDTNISENSFVGYIENYNKETILIGDTTNNNAINGVKISKNSCIKYKTFVNIIKGNGSITNNSIINGILGNKFIDGDYSNFILENNQNGGAAQYVDKKRNVSNFYNSKYNDLTITNNTYIESNINVDEILYITFSNQTVNEDVLLTFHLKDLYNNETAIMNKTLKYALYEPLEIIIPKGYKLRIAWDNTKNVVITRKNIIAI